MRDKTRGSANRTSLSPCSLPLFRISYKFLVLSLMRSLSRARARLLPHHNLSRHCRPLMLNTLVIALAYQRLVPSPPSSLTVVNPKHRLIASSTRGSVLAAPSIGRGRAGGRQADILSFDWLFNADPPGRTALRGACGRWTDSRTDERKKCGRWASGAASLPALPAARPRQAPSPQRRRWGRFSPGMIKHGSSCCCGCSDFVRPTKKIKVISGCPQKWKKGN